jgi:hypothetical protein
VVTCYKQCSKSSHFNLFFLPIWWVLAILTKNKKTFVSLGPLFFCCQVVKCQSHQEKHFWNPFQTCKNTFKLSLLFYLVWVSLYALFFFVSGLLCGHLKISQLRMNIPKQGMKPQNKTRGIDLVRAQVRATLHKLLLRETH